LSRPCRVDHRIDRGHASRISDDVTYHAAPPKQDHGRQGAYPEALSEARRPVEVDPHQLEGGTTSLGEDLQEGVELLARPAPRCVEGDEHRNGRLCDLESKGLIRDLEHGRHATTGSR